MKRRLNFTNRHQLDTSHVRIALHGDGPDGVQRFTAVIDIPAEWHLPASAHVYVEAYVVSTSMRFSFGTVGSLTHPQETRLRDIDSGNVLFRVKVVDESGDVGLLLASAAEIRPKDNSEGEGAGTRAFFPLVMRDIGQAVWSVDITHTDRPKLVLNNTVPGLRDKVLTDPIFQGAILPAAMRLVLEALIMSGEHDDAEWAADWRAFVTTLCGTGIFPEPEEVPEKDEARDLIERIVSDFVDAKRFVQLARATAGVNDE
jgi:hypothetical protein